MGVYNGLMVVPAPFPTVLPKLCILASYCRPYEGEMPRFDLLEFRVWLPGDLSDAPSFTMNVPYDNMAASQFTEAHFPFTDPDIDRVMRVSAPMFIQPFPIRESGYLKVRAFVDGEITKVGALRINSAVASAPQPSQT